MDATAIKSKVDEIVDAKLKACEPFTTACISHPIITHSIQLNMQAGQNADDAIKNRVRHSQIKQIVEERFAADEMYGDSNGMQVAYITSQITVWPNDNKPLNVRLFHPDDPSFDPHSFRATHLNLQDAIDAAIKQPAQKASAPQKARAISMDDDDENEDANANDEISDSIPSIRTTSAGHPVTHHCEIQRKQDTLNIPRVLVKAAGWTVSDEITVKAVGPTVYVRKVDKSKGDQRVDNEGRIRIHGDNVRALKNANGAGVPAPCLALVVEPVNGDGKYIQIQ